MFILYKELFLNILEAIISTFISQFHEIKTNKALQKRKAYYSLNNNIGSFPYSIT